MSKYVHWDADAVALATTRHLASKFVVAEKEIRRLEKELSIAKNSWNYEEGKRVIAQRDAALVEVERLKPHIIGVCSCSTCERIRKALEAKQIERRIGDGRRFHHDRRSSGYGGRRGNILDRRGWRTQ